MSFNRRVLSPGATPFVNNENFGIVTYTGNSGDQSITGLGFQPDFVWIKERSQADNHNVIDSSRGTNKIISPNLTNAEFTSGRFTSFDSDGFTLANNNETNDNGVTYVDTGTITWTVPEDLSNDTMYYWCTLHPGMAGSGVIQVED